MTKFLSIDQAQKLHYSKATSLLLSPGLAAQPLSEDSAERNSLHAKEALHPLTSDKPQGWDLNNQTFDFVTGAWFAKDVRKSSAGTAVDQLGWVFRETWIPFCTFLELINLIAECWVSALA
jgi:hypothetical protein